MVPPRPQSQITYFLASRMIPSYKGAAEAAVTFAITLYTMLMTCPSGPPFTLKLLLQGQHYHYP